MKLEQSEQFYVENLYRQSLNRGAIPPTSSFIVEKLTGDASTRRYYRVTTDKDKHVVCIGDPSGTAESSFITIQNVLNTNNIRTPKIYDHDLNQGLIIQEDLGDITLLRHLATISSQADEMTLYQQCLNIMLQMQTINCQKYQDCSFTQLAFDQAKLTAEINFTIKYFFNSFFQIALSSRDQKLLDDNYGEICKQIATLPRLFVHRDLHSRNIMVHRGELILIDFQDARMGTPYYDLVSLLDDCYYQLSPVNYIKLKQMFWENMPDRPSVGEFEVHYDFMALQRIFKAIGSFAYIYHHRKDVRYVKYIGYCFEKLKTILFKYPQYTMLRKLLTGIYYGH